MLYADIKEDGKLIIRATEPLEIYALRSWEKFHKAGKAKLVIETGELVTFDSILTFLKTNAVEFKKWQLLQKNGDVLPIPLEDKPLSPSI